MFKSACRTFFGVFSQRQTFLNLIYSLFGFGCGLIDLMLFSIAGWLVFGWIVTPIQVIGPFPFAAGSVLKSIGIGTGVALVATMTALLCFFPAFLEQWLAGWLLNVGFPVSPFWTAGGGYLASSARYVLSGAAWRRLLFSLMRIPLGFVSIAAILALLPAVLAVLMMPSFYLAGFRELILGPWRVDSLGESVLVLLAAGVLATLALHGANLFSRLSGRLARAWLHD